MKKKILLISTGGTIASVRTADGLTPGLSGEELVAQVPALQSVCEIDVLQLMQLDSTNVGPQDWIRMAETIRDNYDSYAGFVISHGTDTMAYSSSALTYMLENLAKPVVLTGSQLSLTEEGSDAPANLLTAFHGAVSGRPGVFLAFAGKLHQGDAVKKLYTESFAGFGSVNVPVCAQLEADELHWNEAWLATCPASPEGAFSINTRLDSRVAVLELVPGLSGDVIKALADSGCRGIILKAYGAGGIPGAASCGNLLPAIDYALAKGVRVVATTQCLYDGVNMELYEVGVTALKHGVTAAGKETSEALAVKLMLELGKDN